MSSVQRQRQEHCTHLWIKEILEIRDPLKISILILIFGFLFILFNFKVIALLSHGGVSSPLFPFDMFAKCYVAEDKCPNDNVTFWLYTR